MLSLFSSVGICRILRYGSSNTSTVEQQVCPRFFSGPSKFGEMRRCERKMLKCNAELVDIVFRLMFETFWVAPYDLRRDFPVLVNFERHARHASVLLGKIDFASASGAQIYELGKTVAALDRAVRQIAEARLFSPVECAEAQELVGRPVILADKNTPADVRSCIYRRLPFAPLYNAEPCAGIFRAHTHKVPPLP